MDSFVLYMYVSRQLVDSQSIYWSFIGTQSIVGQYISRLSAEFQQTIKQVDGELVDIQPITDRLLVNYPICQASVKSQPICINYISDETTICKHDPKILLRTLSGSFSTEPSTQLTLYIIIQQICTMPI